MRRARAYLLAALGLAGVLGVSLYVALPTTAEPHVRAMDRRCRGGCTDTALLRVLQGGVNPGIVAAGVLKTSAGKAVTVSRASAKFCSTGTAFDPSNTQARYQDIGAWNAQAATLASNVAIAPDGRTTAGRITDNSTNTFHGASFQANAGLVTTSAWTASVYLKAGTCGFAGIVSGGLGSGATWNLATGALVFVTGGLTASAATDAGNGWWRAVVTFPSTVANDAIYIIMNPAGSAASLPSYVGTSQTVFAWGAKVENGSSATAYVSPMLVSLGSNVPCVESAGVLVEKTSINLLPRSAELGTAPWSNSGSVTVTADQAIAPDGTLTADRLQIAATPTGFNYRSQTSVTLGNATTYTLSVWLMGVSGSGTVYLFGTPDAVTYGRTACAYSATAWARCTVTFTTTSATVWFLCIGTDLRDTSQSAKPANDVYAWGAQLEAAPFATSYVPTAGTSATRATESITYGVVPVSNLQGRMQVTFTPRFTGSAHRGTTIFAASDAYPVASFLYSNGSDPTMYFFDGSIAALVGSYAAGVARSYEVSWTPTGRRIRDLTAGTSATGPALVNTFSQFTLIGDSNDGWLRDIAVFSR